MTGMEARIIAVLKEHGPLTASVLIDKLRCEHCGMAPVDKIRDVVRASPLVAMNGNLEWYVVG